MTTIHVIPTDDIISHENETEDCVCGVTVVPVLDDNGCCSWLIQHNALDGRP